MVANAQKGYKKTGKDTERVHKKDRRYGRKELSSEAKIPELIQYGKKREIYDN